MALLIFTYSATGLGHLRVTDALVDGRPKDHPYLLMGSEQDAVTALHRFSSKNVFARTIFEASQSGWMEDYVSSFFEAILQFSSGRIYRQLVDVINKEGHENEVVIIATHPGIAHKIGFVKEKLMKTCGVKIKLIVQVTDDTPQHIWCVNNADITMVPSQKTKDELELYAKEKKISTEFEVLPYPVSPELTKSFGGYSKSRSDSMGVNDVINIALPISGAATGLPFLLVFIKSILGMSRKFRFFVVAKRGFGTSMFLSQLAKYKEVMAITGRNDSETVLLYEKMYLENIIHLEITKPSEQAFKSLLTTDMVGGSILLFLNAVGKQEYDNLDFLKRHGLLIDKKNFAVLKDPELKGIYRGIQLPGDPQLAAKLVLWCQNSGVFRKLVELGKSSESDDIEVSPCGVKLFWEMLQKRGVVSD